MDKESVSCLTKDRPWVRQHKVRTAFAGAKWRSLFLLTNVFYKQMWEESSEPVVLKAYKNEEGEMLPQEKSNKKKICIILNGVLKTTGK